MAKFATHMGDPHGDPQTSPQHADPHGFLAWFPLKRVCPFALRWNHARSRHRQCPAAIQAAVAQLVEHLTIDVQFDPGQVYALKFLGCHSAYTWPDRTGDLQRVRLTS